MKSRESKELNDCLKKFNTYRSYCVLEKNADEVNAVFVRLTQSLAKLTMEDTRAFIGRLELESSKLLPVTFLGLFHVSHSHHLMPFQKAKMAALIHEGKSRSAGHTTELHVLIDEMVADKEMRKVLKAM